MQLSSVPAWDVAALLTYAMLRMYSGLDHAWEIVTALSFACSLDRDMSIHELIQGFYMVRYSCHTVQLGGSVGYIMCVLVAGVSMCAQTDRYQQQGHIIRRATVGTATLLAVLVRYDWNSNPAFSVVRLAVFIVTTRISVSDYDMDSWDAALQAIWLLVVPAYAYILVALQIFAKYCNADAFALRRRKPSDSCLV